MGENTRQGNLAAHEVRELFNQTLGDHLERLIGTRYGIEALPISLATISRLILLTERENDIESFPSSPPDRYTRETLLNELAAINLDTDEEMNIAVQDMIQKGYIDVDDAGSFFPKKPTTSMVQLFDMVLPGMPGMNLVVYFAQIMYEAQSGRKDLRTTINQFDKTLQKQGVPEDLTDDAIEKRIASFEEDLAMICPLCKTAKVQTEKTATNKIYCKCSNKDCNFISWGKPYHIVCEQCGNLFLVETTSRDGKTILKCPRSTCRYWLKHPSDTTDEPLEKAVPPAQTPAKSTITPRKPRRRVVRKVVRRKR